MRYSALCAGIICHFLLRRILLCIQSYKQFIYLIYLGFLNGTISLSVRFHFDQKKTDFCQTEPLDIIRNTHTHTKQQQQISIRNVVTVISAELLLNHVLRYIEIGSE